MSDHAHRPNEPHDPHHSHGHGHGHGHDHAQTHDHGSAPHHHPRPAPQPATTVASLLMSSAWLRLVGAAALTACLWLAVAWALAGTT
jgi:ABC-type Zn2+ transport system substrate-binding protein/surface adhesin